MKIRNLLILVLIVAVAGAAAYFSIDSIVKNLTLGLDIRGGVYVLLGAKDPDVTDHELLMAAEVLRRRVDELGVTQPEIVPELENKRIRVSLPGIDDQQKAFEIIGRTAQLKFVDPDGKEVLTGAKLVDAQARINQATREPYVAIQFTDEGAATFKDLTTKWLDKPIYIFLDDKLISHPIVKEVISDGKAQITGLKDIEEAKELALLLRAGFIPVELTELDTRSIGPSLGTASLNKSILAAEIGAVLVLAFMVLFYGLPGLMADIALGIYGILVLWALTAMNATLTLPGIAGLILSVGMAVDANIIIFERIKEETRRGKTALAAVEAGFRRALSAILDANVTTLIAAGVLLFYGTGPVKGFGVTLGTGILLSMFTAIFVTRYLLKLLAGTGVSLTRFSIVGGSQS